MKQWAEAFYKSFKWQRCRAAYIADRLLIDGGLCEECHDRFEGHGVGNNNELLPRIKFDASGQPFVADPPP